MIKNLPFVLHFYLKKNNDYQSILIISFFFSSCIFLFITLFIYYAKSQYSGSDAVIYLVYITDMTIRRKPRAPACADQASASGQQIFQ